MKKAFRILTCMVLALAMAMSLAACGEKKGDSSEAESVVNSAANSVVNSAVDSAAEKPESKDVASSVASAAAVINVKEEERVKIGETVQVVATLNPEGDGSDTLTYVTGNTKKATVDEKGNVTGLSEGNTWLTITSKSGVTAKCLIRVVK